LNCLGRFRQLVINGVAQIRNGKWGNLTDYLK